MNGVKLIMYSIKVNILNSIKICINSAVNI